jgi:glycosyltransferase involved in cell wall biosynthesis
MRKVEESMLAPAIRNARVIPNGVDVSVFSLGDQQEARTLVGIAREAKVLLFVGNRTRSSRWKDYPMMESAVERVADRLPEKSLIIVCLGEKGETERIGRAEARFIGYQQEPAIVAQYYRAADIYVHAARADTFPNTVLEALACGSPVVATGVGGIPEQIDDGVTGFVTNRGDAAHMATRIEQLLSDDDLRKRMGVQAAQSVHNRFGLRRHVKNYLDWYNEILEDSQSKKGE